MRRHHTNSTAGAPNRIFGFNPEFPLGFETMADALFEAVFA